MATNASKLKLFFRLLPVLGLICLLVGFGMAIKQARFTQPAYVVSGIGVLLFLTLFIKAEVANLKYYLHVFVYSVMVLGICSVGYLFARQYTKKVDLTENKYYSLSEASSKYLKNLKKDVKVTIFYMSGDPFREIMKQYTDETNKVTWEAIDARKKPEAAHEFGETVRNGDVFVQVMNKDKDTTAGATNRKKISVGELNENNLTNAIVEVTRETKPKLYFLKGHGEISFEEARAGRGQEAPPSLAAFRNFLTERAIQAEQLDLVRTGFVPKDASAVILAGPERDLFPGEVGPLQEYLAANGKLLILLNVPQGQIAPAMPNTDTILRTYGVSTPNKVVLDMVPAQFGGSPAQATVAGFDKEHPITKRLAERETSFFLNSMARPIQTENAREDFKVTPLAKSSDYSWTEDLSVLAQGRVNPPPRDQMSPQTLAVI